MIFCKRKVKVNNMAVIIGSARIDENGRTSGGRAGDQTKGEVAIQNWYLHSKGWVVIRPRRAEVAAAIARNMQAGCDNDLIGYDQSQRNTALTESREYNYDLAEVKAACETDCSALVRLCCLYAGVKVGNFSTASEVNALRATGEFDILTDARYCQSSDYLRPGDILVTRTRGHTAVVLSQGAQVTADQQSKPDLTASPPQNKVAAAMHRTSNYAGAYYTVTDLEMLYRPGTVTPDNVVCAIPAGKTVRCYGFYNVIKGAEWYLVAHKESEGYVLSKYLRRL